MSKLTRIIRNEEFLLRRLAPGHQVNLETRTISWRACQTNNQIDPELSMHLEELYGDIRVGLERANRGHFGMGKVNVKAVRDLGLEVTYDPQDDDSSHCIVTGIKSRTKSEELVALMELVFPPA